MKKFIELFTDSKNYLPLLVGVALGSAINVIFGSFAAILTGLFTITTLVTIKAVRLKRLNPETKFIKLIDWNLLGLGYFVGFPLLVLQLSHSADIILVSGYMVLLLISMSICFGFLFYIKYVLNVNSASQSYYMFELIKKGKGILFTIWTIITGLTLFPIWVHITPDSFQFLTFLSVIALIGVGIEPKYLKEDKISHVILTVVTAGLSITWGILMGYWYIPTGLICLAALITIKQDDLLYWLEIAAFFSIYICVYISLLVQMP